MRDQRHFYHFSRSRVVVSIAAVVGAIVASVAGTAVATAALPPQSAVHPSWLPATPDQWPLVVDENTTQPQTITHGLSYHQDTLNSVGGVQKAQVLEANLADSNLRLGVVESHDQIVDPANETISSMAHRTGAVAGVNADFFAIHGSGTPLGMVVQNGRLIKSPNPSWTANFGVRADGSITIGNESYTGTITDGTATHPLTSVNTVDDVKSGGITRATADLGATPISSATVVSGRVNGATLVVDSVNTGVTSLPSLPSGTEDLVGGGAGAAWLAQNIHPGDTVTISEKISPDNNLQQAVSGGAVLVKDGQMAVPLQGGGENNQPNPVTGVGVTKDGKHLIVAAFDGHQPETSAEGLTRPQLAGWMMQHGAYNAILFDSGGSTEMVGRLPGQTQASVLNTPSDGQERSVANGLFIYSAAAQSGPATTAVVNGGKPLTMLAGSQVPVSAYATDAAGNPASDPVRLAVDPSQLATVQDGVISAGSQSGHGLLRVQAGSAASTVPLQVVDQLANLTVTPTEPNLSNGGTQQFGDAGTAKDGTPVTLPTSAVHWTVDNPALGSITNAGLFSAASDGSGMVTVTASAGGASATATVAVGQTAVTVDPLTDPAQFGVVDKYMNVWPRNVPSPGAQSIPVGSMSASSVKRLPTDTGSLKLHYDFPAAQRVYHLDLYPNDPGHDVIPAKDGQVPTAIGVWVKTEPPLGGGLYFSAGIYQVNNQPNSLYPPTATTDGWQHIVIPLPAGLQYPLRFNYLNLVVINPKTELAGDMYVSDLEALYSPRPPKPYVYTPVPKNPSWLTYAEDPAQFRNGGSTLAAFDDAHVRAAEPNATGSVVMGQVAKAFQALPPTAKPSVTQALGDMADVGTLDNLNWAKSLLNNLGTLSHDAVGNHEISQGVDPENGNFTQVFGPTHYSYTAGDARVAVTDSAHGGLLASNAYQVPGDEQYRWLVDQLSANTSKVMIVATHMPAYDPHPVQNSQFADRWEAQMYERLIQRYQQTHPQVHTLLMFGHARGVAEQVLLPDGTQSPDGLPNFTIADAGSPAYAPADEGGFYQYGLFHVNSDGTVQFAIQPVLNSITVTASAQSLQVGHSMDLAATGTTPTGNDLPALQVPIADPASHVWSSSDPKIVAIDARTGKVTAGHPGTATVSVTSGGVTGSITLTVTG